MEEIKICKCGGEARLVTITAYEAGKLTQCSYRVECTNCDDKTAKYMRASAAISAWNGSCAATENAILATEFEMKLADRLKELRKIKGVSQVQLAAYLGYSKGTVAMWETEERKPNHRALIALAKYFNTSTDYLLGNIKEVKTEEALKLVIAERGRQMVKWGDQSGNHPLEWVGILGEEFGELCEAITETSLGNAQHRERGGLDNILKEAIHVAAVAVAIAETVIAKKGRGDGYA